MDIETLNAELCRAWSSETSADPTNWSSTNPAWGQCAVTALIVQDYFGGELRRCKINGISHYWNELPGGQQVDLTKRQFHTIESQTDTEPRTREYVLSFPETVSRYELLKKNLERQTE